ncbi:MAG: hypothetical protein GY839_08165 [candidate division Zixibacteria bacterium]|nr:hypothetical protein [candidate division Zixibacteria bacterium]
MAVLKVTGLEQARQLFNDDPILQNKILGIEVKDWEPAVTGYIGSEGE